jgi:hypothetical protein
MGVGLTDPRNSTSWRIVHASVPGTSHRASGQPHQDACAVDLIDTPAGEVLVVAAADGAGSATHADVGAQSACDAVLGEVRDILGRTPDLGAVTCEHVTGWFVGVHASLAEEARARDVSPRDLACTLLVAVVGPTCAVFAQIGDGAIVIGDGQDGTYRVVFWPQSGEYANTTYFVTEPEPLTHLQCASHAGPVEELALLSDGLQALALRYETREPHLPFFRPMFARLREEAPGTSPVLSDALAAWLNSDAVNARTDDDKTLVLAPRSARRGD